MRFSKTEKTASLIFGAAAGAVAMYLLDPKQGQARRDRIASAAGDQLSNAKDAAQQFASVAATYGSQVADKAADLGRRAQAHVSGHIDAAHEAIQDGIESARSATNSGMDTVHASQHARVARVKALVDQAYAAASGVAGDAADQGHSLFSKATESLAHLWDKYNPSHLASHLRDTAADAASDAQSRASDARDRGTQWVNAARIRAAKKIAPELSESSSIVLPVAASAVACGLVGVGAMYFLDSERGADRREMAIDQARETVRRTGHFFRASGREIGDRLRGLSKQTRQLYGNVVSSQDVHSSDELVTSIRSSLEAIAPEHAKLLQVLADNSGRVTVSGIVPAEQRERVIAAISKVDGVTEVINRLTKAPEATSGLTGDLSGGQPRVDPSAPAKHATL